MDSRSERGTGPASSSRSSPGEAGWTCATVGSFGDAMPPDSPRFSWLRPTVLWRSRNDVVARRIDDPTDELRRRWVAAQRDRGIDCESPIDRTELEEFSFLLLGDTGEGDRSQYAVVPVLLRVGGDTAFTVISGDVVYPTGSVNDYERKFFHPYRDYPAPIYAVPANHDWYDSLAGFMRVFCDAPPLPPSPRPARRLTRAWLRDLLWAEPDRADEAAFAAVRKLRGAPAQQVEAQRAEQPGPYWAMDTGPIRIVAVDVGITGHLDAEQGSWLRRVSRGDKPKVLLTGEPIYSDNKYRPCPIEGGGTVDEIVRDPGHRYAAVIGGDIHNYQRYPVRIGDRTIQYVVAGGGGAFMHATHPIPRVTVGGVDEEEFRCYPLRGDSLSFYSYLYDRRLRLGGRLAISPEQAAALMADANGTTSVRARGVMVTRRTRWKARILGWLPAGPFFDHWFSEFSAWNRPPFFKSFVRVDVRPSALVLRCYAATGCREHELHPPLEDEVTIPLP